MVAVHQFLQSFVKHDAISSHARHLQRILTEMDIPSDIYAGEQRSGRNAAKFFRDFQAEEPVKDTWMLFHLSIGGAIADFLQTRNENVAVNYHNISPVELFGPWEPQVGIELEAARRQLKELAPISRFSVAVSEYNRGELVEAGYREPVVAPVLFDPADFHREYDRTVDARLQAHKEVGGSDWLFVGRVSPHKCHHDIVKAFAVYRQMYDDQARLHLVGGMGSHHYWTVLRRYIDALDLGNHVNLPGVVSNGALGAYYRNADVFVCLSGHEGFGVPLLEAMYNRVPIIAHDAAAVPETVGNAALVLRDKSPGSVAVAVQRLLHDDRLRAALIDAGTARLDDFALSKSEARWREVIGTMVATSA